MCEKWQITSSQRVPSDASASSKQWLYRFVQRREELRTRFPRAYGFQRALLEDPNELHKLVPSILEHATQVGDCGQRHLQLRRDGLYDGHDLRSNGLLQ